jgi:hypothetical protein
MMLCGMPFQQIAADMKVMYGVTFSELHLEEFRLLFADIDYSEGVYWENYSTCIPNDELVFKTKLKYEPKDFVRWKLGVPVALDTEVVLNRMVSDAYYTERQLKASGDIDKEALVRIKMERDTLFKSVDRLLKLREASGTGASQASVQADMQKILLQHSGTVEFLTKDALVDG